MGVIRRIAKKMCVAAVSVGLIAGACLQVSASQSTYIRGTFNFWAHDNNHDLTDSYIYTDSFFDKSAYETDQHLAIASMILAEVSISSKDVDYSEKSKNIKEFLNQIGFKDVEVNQYYQEKMLMNSLGVAVAYKEMGDTVLLAIVPRSAGYEAEWGGNFNVGSSGLHEGFKIGRDIALGFAKNYVANHQEVFNGKKVKVWTSGYSRGAGVANLIGAALDDDSVGYIGIDVDPENIYDYSFGTPLTAASDLDPRNDKYNNIHNYFSDYDPVSMMPFSQWGFQRFGQDVALDVHNTDTKSKMLEYLSNTNSQVYQSYITSQDPDNFQSMTLGVENGEIKIVPDTTRSTSQREFLLKVFNNLTSTIVPTREIYSEKYEQAVTEATALLIGEDDETVAAFVKGAGSSSSIKKLAIMLFFYNWAEQYISQRGQDTALDEGWQTEVIPTPITDEDATSGNDVADAVLESDTYKEIYDEATSDMLEEQYGQDLNTYSDLMDIYRLIAGKYMSNVLRAGLEAIGYSGEDLENHPLIQGNNAEALSEVAAQALFGTDDSLSINGAINKVKNAATAIGNNFMRVHNNEIILSWLRAMDTDPIGDDPITYTITGDEKWTKGSENGLELKSDAGTIIGFEIDGQKSEQYQISDDKQSIIINAALLETLEVGKHMVTVVFEDGEGDHEFEIVEAETPIPTATPAHTSVPAVAPTTLPTVTPTTVPTAAPTSLPASTTGSNKTNTTGVSTGDTTNAYLWISIVGLASVIIVITAVVNHKKKR